MIKVRARHNLLDLGSMKCLDCESEEDIFKNKVDSSKCKCGSIKSLIMLNCTHRMCLPCLKR